MLLTDEQNLQLAVSAESVDTVNAEFYGRFQYPWRPMAFDCVNDPDFEAVMLNQSLGSWEHSMLPRQPKIWVAGCGTNQAVFTALRFPNATVLGSDLSSTSLETAQNTARMLGVTNLSLRQESLNQVKYDKEFDYVLCTGVIHHNAEPIVPLHRLARALKPDGVLELMVYNRFHRTMPTAFQKAIRLFGGGSTKVDFESELQIAQRIITGMTAQNEMTKFLDYFKDCSESELADVLLQPVEYSFTVESLEELARGRGLEMAAPCINSFDQARETYFWNMEFSDPALQELYDSFADTKRWRIANCLLFDKSPMLWFYLRRSDAAAPCKSEKQLADEFLAQTFVPSDARRTVFLRNGAGEYKLLPTQNPYPRKHPKEICRAIIAGVTARPGATLREILTDLKVEPSFSTVNKLRLWLTTSAFPFLRAAKA
jgi:SAM-dependent methyltransferase